MAIRKHYDERRLALAVSRLIDSVEQQAKDGKLSTDEALKALHALAGILPAYGKLLESVNMAGRLDEVEKMLNEKVKA